MPTSDTSTQFSMAYSYNGINWYEIPTFLTANSQNPIFTSGTAIGSNPGIGAVVVDSQLTLSKSNIPNTQTLDIVSSSYYDFAFTNFSVQVISHDL